MPASARTRPSRYSTRLALVLGLAAAAGAFRGERGPAAPPEPPAAPHADREGFPLPAEAVARVGSARLRHGQYRPNVDYSPDGTLLSSCGGGLLRLWEARTGKLVREVRMADGVVPRESGRAPDGIFSRDGKTVVAIDGTFCRWFDVRTGNEVAHCNAHFSHEATDSGYYARFGPFGETLAVIDQQDDKDLAVYELPSGKKRFRNTAGQSRISGMAFSPDGKILATKVDNGKESSYGIRTQIVDTATGRLLGEFDPREVSRGMRFAPDGKRMLSCDPYKAVYIREVPSGKVLQSLSVDPHHFLAAAFTPDGKSVVCTGWPRDAVRVDLATGKRDHFRAYPAVARTAFSPDGKTLAIASSTGAVTQWDLETGRRLAASAEPASRLRLSLFDGDGNLLCATSEEFTVVDWRTGRAARRVPLPLAEAGTRLALPRDGSRIAGANAAGQLAVWDAASGKQLWSLPDTLPWYATITLSPDGKKLYTDSPRGSVRELDAGTGKELRVLDGKNHAHPAAVSPDGRHLAGAAALQAGSEVIVWDLASGRDVHHLPLPVAEASVDLAFSPDGDALATVGSFRFAGLGLGGEGRGSVALWDVRTGKNRFIHTGLPEDYRRVAFAPDGRMIVAGSEKGAVQLWEAASGKERHRFTGHEMDILDVGFSPDGKFVAAASADAPLYVWDVEGCHDKPASTVAFTSAEEAGLWSALGNEDAAAAFDALRRLLARPGPAVALLRSRLAPIGSADEQSVRRMLLDLDADSFAVREKATTDLEAVADRIESRLRKALAENPSAEAKRRIERVLGSADRLSPGRLREVRAVEVLERLGTAEARRLLGTLAGGIQEAVLAREARSAAERLRAR